MPADTLSKSSNDHEVYKKSERYRIQSFAPLLLNYSNKSS